MVTFDSLLKSAIAGVLTSEMTPIAWESKARALKTAAPHVEQYTAACISLFSKKKAMLAEAGISISDVILVRLSEGTLEIADVLSLQKGKLI